MDNKIENDLMDDYQKLYNENHVSWHFSHEVRDIVDDVSKYCTDTGDRDHMQMPYIQLSHCDVIF